jgi:hypothetical protein
MPACLGNLAVDFGLLGQKILQGRHVSKPRLNSTIETSYRGKGEKKLDAELMRDALHACGGLVENIHPGRFEYCLQLSMNASRG